MVAIAVPVAARVDHRIIQRFRDAGALSYATAQPMEDWRWIESRRLARLVEGGVVRRTESGALYLDEAAWTAHVAMRRKLALVLLVVVVLLFIGVLVFQRFRP